MFSAAPVLHCCCLRAFSGWGELELLSSCGVQASHYSGFCCRAQVLGAQQLTVMGSRAWAQLLWPRALVTPRHVGSSHTRDLNCVLCIDRWILNHWTTREAPEPILSDKCVFTLRPRYDFIWKKLDLTQGKIIILLVHPCRVLSLHNTIPSILCNSFNPHNILWGRHYLNPILQTSKLRPRKKGNS